MRLTDAKSPTVKDHVTAMLAALRQDLSQAIARSVTEPVTRSVTDPVTETKGQGDFIRGSEAKALGAEAPAGDNASKLFGPCLGGFDGRRLGGVPSGLQIESLSHI